MLLNNSINNLLLPISFCLTAQIGGQKKSRSRSGNRDWCFCLTYREYVVGLCCFQTQKQNYVHVLKIGCTNRTSLACFYQLLDLFYQLTHRGLSP